MIWTERALAGLQRVHDFLLQSDASTASRAVATIRDSLAKLEEFPELGRAVPDEPGARDWLVHFGRTGYKVRYRNVDGQIVILALRHMRESEFYVARIPDA